MFKDKDFIRGYQAGRNGLAQPGFKSGASGRRGFLAGSANIPLPVNLSPPTISGSATVAGVLTVTPGIWQFSPGALAYQWVADGVDLAGQTGLTYTKSLADDGKTITCRETASNGSGAVSASSNAIGPITRLAPVNTAIPVITGTAQEGQTLSASTGSWSNSPTAFTYQWKRAGVAIAGSINSTRVLTSADVGFAITVTVTASNSGGSASATSAATGTVISAGGALPVNTVAPVIAGDIHANEGSVLTVTPGTWSNSPSSVTHQWRADGVDIAGETGLTLTKTAALDGKTILCREVASNATGSAAVASNSIGPLSAAPYSTSAPVITGTAQEGQALSTDSGGWGNAPTSLPIQWKRDGVAIPGEVATTYLVATADIGHVITVTVTASNTYGGASATSTATSSVIAAGPPVISTLTSISVSENVALALDLIADQAVAWSIVGGADQALFNITGGASPGFGAHLNLPARNFEGVGAANSASADSVYHVTVRATSGSALTTDLVATVTVLDAHVTIANRASQSVGSSTNSPADFPITVSAAANKVLVIGVTQQGAVADPGGTIVAVSTDNFVTTLPGVIKATQSGVQNVGARYSRAELWYLIAPPTGSLKIRATRQGSGGCRTNITAFVMQDCAQEAPQVVMTPLFSSSTAGSYASSITTASDDMAIVALAWTEFTNATALTLGQTLDDTSTITAGVGATQQVGALCSMERVAAGVQALSYTDTLGGVTSTSRYGGMLAAAWRSVPHIAVDPFYYVSNGGNDLNDGLSDATAFATLSPIEVLSPLVPGTIINLKRGQVHRRAAPSEAAIGTGQSASTPLFMLKLKSGAVSALQPVTMQPYGPPGADPMIAGDIVYTGWTAATSAETNATAFGFGAEKQALTSPAANTVRTHFPCLDDYMLQPCIWAPQNSGGVVVDGGYPSSIFAWDDSALGGDSFHFPPNRVQPSQPGVYPFSANVSGAYDVTCAWTGANKNATGTWTVNFIYPAIGTHYGAFSPVGAFVVFRSSADQSPYYRITSYDQATGRITCTYTGAVNDGPTGAGGISGLYWAIVGHPLDLVKKGQFAWSVGGSGKPAADTTCYAIWPDPGTGVKSITRYAYGACIYGDHWRVNNIQFARNAAETGTTGVTNLVSYGGDDHIWDSIRLRQKICLLRTQSFADSSTPADFPAKSGFGSFTNFTFDEAKTENAFHMGSTHDSVFANAFGRNLGRSCLYEAGGGSTASNGNVWRNIDFCEHLAIHGNGITNYQGSSNSLQEGVGVTGSSTPETSQTKGSGSTVGPLQQSTWSASNAKAVTRRFHFLTPSRDIGTSANGTFTIATPVSRLDGGDYGSRFDRCIMPFAGGSSTLSVGYGDPTGADPLWSAGSGNNGLVVERCILHDIAVDVTNHSLAGCVVKNCLVMSGAASTAALVALLQSAGATVTNVILDTTPWNGCPTVAQQQMYTLNDAGDAFQDTQIGPSSWAWTMPAYVGPTPNVTLQPLGISSGSPHDAGYTLGTVRNGFQAGKEVGTIIRTSPGSSLALTAGGANFVLDVKGVIVAKVTLTTGTYTFDVTETNTVALGGPLTRTTTITIMVTA